jgi:hypothetical protein
MYKDQCISHSDGATEAAPSDSRLPTRGEIGFVDLGSKGR